ncbi:MAG: hypothetical protein WCQ99_15175 [Pseudomonadota bacterium]
MNAPKFFFVCLAACGLFFSCSSSEKKAAELYELAAFEQQQFNRENSLKLYDRILSEYPDTMAAKKTKAARESLLLKAQ